MASASSVGALEDARSDNRVAVLKAELERSERRRRAALEWAEFLERELEARDERLEAVVHHYEARLAAERRSDGSPGLWDRLTDWWSVGL